MNPIYLTNKNLLEFSSMIEDERNSLSDTLPFFTSRKLSDSTNELEVLRRWNSHTPMLHEAFGGGYLLRWKGRGIVIDPGCTFIDVFQRSHVHENVKPHCIEDIDLVVVTHDHIDHSDELNKIVIILRAYNKWKKKVEGVDYMPKKIDIITSYGVFHANQSFLLHPENSYFINSCKVLPVRDVEENEISLWNDYCLRLKCLRTDHREVFGDRSGFGLRFSLFCGDTPFVLCDAGDTKYNHELVPQYEGCDLLILHIGTLESLPSQVCGRGEHLCFGGTLSVLNRLTNKPKLVLLSEWGQEFRLPGVRDQFTQFVHQYTDIQSPILPADLGMRIRIPDCHIWCAETDDYIAPIDVKVEDHGQWLNYVKR